MEEIYGFPALMPLDVDFVNYTNEDIGFNASLVAGTNDVISIALPYPATLDLFDETIVVHCIEHIIQQASILVAGTSASGLMAHYSYLDRQFGASWFGVLSDADDEAMKAQFAGPMYFGVKGFNVTATSSVEGNYRQMDSNVIAKYFPPVPLDLITPLFIQFTGQSNSVTLATNAVAEASFTLFERVVTRVWFNRRNLTPSERQSRNMSIRFQRLDS